MSKVGKITVVGKKDDVDHSYFITRKYSVLGNPFITGVDGTRDEVIAKHRIHLDSEMKDLDSPVRARIYELAQKALNGKDINLRCVCKPKSCHGDYVKETIERVMSESVIDPSKDGITHINVYSKGKTELGRALSNFSNSPFNHPEYGRIESIEGFWYYLVTGERYPQLLSLSGYDAKREGRRHARVLSTTSITFRKKIRDALMGKILSNKVLYMMVLESTLPFKHYYIKQGEVIDPKGDTSWFVETLTFIRIKIKEEGRPMSTAKAFERALVSIEEVDT